MVSLPLSPELLSPANGSELEQPARTSPLASTNAVAGRIFFNIMTVPFLRFFGMQSLQAEASFLRNEARAVQRLSGPRPAPGPARARAPRPAALHLVPCRSGAGSDR